MKISVLGFVVAVAALTGCGGSPPPLANTNPSADATAAAVLDAVWREDAVALRGLVLSEQEFRDHVWPELPAARPERNLPFSYVWGDLRQKSEAGLAATLRNHGGRRYSLVRVDFSGETTYPSYRVRRDTTLTVKDSGGVEQQIRLFGSMLEKDGEWKVFSFVIDD